MGLMDFLSTMAEMDPNDIAAGGLIGAAIKANVKKQAAEKAQRPKPGVFCRGVCVVNDERCQPCLALQQEYGNLISEIAKLEEMADLTSEQVQQLTQRKQITKCSLCGAPFEKGNKVCPYCSTPYPEDGIDFEVPLSKPERRAMISSKTEEAWNSYLKLDALISQYLKDTAGNDLYGKIQKFAGGMSVLFQGMMKHSVAELQQGADHYGVSMSQYLYGIGTGEMKAYKTLKAEEDQVKRLEAQQRQNVQFQQQQAQLQANRPKPYTGLDWMQQRAQNPRNVNYGGIMASCSNCKHWLSTQNLCALTGGYTPTGKICNQHDYS